MGGYALDIRAIAFDVNGTLIEIATDDDAEQIFRAAGHFLTYQGINLRRHQVQDLYFQYMKQQRKASSESHPEYDAPAIWSRIIDEHMTNFTRSLPHEKLVQLPLFLAEMGRGISRHRLRLYPHVRSVLRVLHEHFALALVTDAQSAYARAELHQVGLLKYFDSIVVSGDHGYRKPDSRLFERALQALGTAPEHTLYVGDNAYRDIYGAGQAGMRTVLFDSDRGKSSHRDCVADFTIDDHRQLLDLLRLPGLQ
jgi:putative hydrolase of the HAD superfamily